MELIDGKATAAQIKEEIAAKVRERAAEGKKIPHLAAILVGHDGGSESYVANKIKSLRGVRIPLVAHPLRKHRAESFESRGVVRGNR